MKRILIFIALIFVLSVANIFAAVSFYGLIGSDVNKKLNFGANLFFMDKVGVGVHYILNTDSIDPAMTEQEAIGLGAVYHEYEEQLRRTTAVYLIYKVVNEFGVYGGVNLDTVEVYRSYEYPEDTFFWTDVEEIKETPMAFGVFVDIDNFALQTGINTGNGFDSLYIMLGWKIFGL